MGSIVRVKYPTVSFQSVSQGVKFKTSPESDVLFMKTGPVKANNLTTGKEVEIQPGKFVYRVDTGSSIVKYGDLQNCDFFLYEGTLHIYLDGSHKRLGTKIPEFTIKNDTIVRRVNVNIEVVY